MRMLYRSAVYQYTLLTSNKTKKYHAAICCFQFSHLNPCTYIKTKPQVSEIEKL